MKRFESFTGPEKRVLFEALGHYQKEMRGRINNPELREKTRKDAETRFRVCENLREEVYPPSDKEIKP